MAACAGRRGRDGRPAPLTGHRQPAQRGVGRPRHRRGLQPAHDAGGRLRPHRARSGGGRRGVPAGMAARSRSPPVCRWVSPSASTARRRSGTSPRVLCCTPPRASWPSAWPSPGGGPVTRAALTPKEGHERHHHHTGCPLGPDRTHRPRRAQRARRALGGAGTRRAGTTTSRGSIRASSPPNPRTTPTWSPMPAPACWPRASSCWRPRGWAIAAACGSASAPSSSSPSPTRSGTR